MSAIEALGTIRDPAAAEELIRITTQMHPYDLSFIVDALKKHQYVAQIIMKSNSMYDTYKVKHPSEQDWIHLPWL